MSDTPETDTKQHFMYMDAVECVEIDFARKLERERNCYKSAVEVITKERDEARAALQRIKECDMRWSKKIARDALEAAK